MFAFDGAGPDRNGRRAGDWFYRDADAFKALARLAHERLAERGNALPLRVLSLPCSTGEEPYTIAMTLLDAGFDAAQLRIDAMDISDRSLATAQRAVYGRNSFRGNAFPFRDAHFTRTEDGWRLAPRIVEAVRFSRANLMQLDASSLGVYDFVFCRNVLIYFDRDAQQKPCRRSLACWPKTVRCSSALRKPGC